MLKFISKLWTKEPLAKYEVNKDYVFNDTIPEGFMTNTYLPDVLFDTNIIVYNIGFDKNRNVFRVIARPRRNEVGDSPKK